jgi:hypothetical protein
MYDFQVPSLYVFLFIAMALSSVRLNFDLYYTVEELPHIDRNLCVHARRQRITFNMGKLMKIRVHMYT